ncbi:MFS transporter [Elizabethkingia meningoseptica]|uniref:MFS transporter n=1 Tax=Elizabethkingia meningoseptica TaxID=238 RepID=UPI000332C179|nr:MFS transporter [Elizabethkingia meningoseptica]AQX05606.1 MFS transporter [Elizabethkingia meningoseptica]AQX47650.1 MFS transporter [Elizabethkingia meningoseptica]EOR29629.1 Major facilitator superfamily (MFS) permease [Elizabethkingia meningoseptica ATCC 13253 = NBRC 12535]KUY24085.1 MFS transporter [Elizabethkingia meningoseptica]OPB67714.1 MFS transporter [Elizabethkingia meningoseptica]
MQELTLSAKLKYIFSIPVIISALGYFVDIYDLLLFGIVRIPSLKDLGLNPDADGTFILNCQMVGLLVGGVFWGIFGDKKGRLSVLFGSILVYSLANIACGFLPYFPKHNLVYSYAGLRFIAGLGLAGELGAGITLVSESLPKELRAIGTSVVAGFGLMGAVVAQLTVELSGGWNISYIIGGGLGILLLFLRISVSESGIYKNIKTKDVSKGNFLSFFTNKDRLVRYLKCIAVGLPTWYCIGILAVLANQFAPELGIKEINPGKAIMWGYVGISIGDLMSGFISHALKSRKMAIFYMLVFTIIGVAIMLFGNTNTETKYYIFCVWLGLGTGYWAMFVTLAAEQFGTNIRNTATTTVPNMVRGLVPVMILAFDFFKNDFSVIMSAAIVGIIVFGLAFYSTLTISETHNKDLEFTE